MKESTLREIHILSGVPYLSKCSVNVYGCHKNCKTCDKYKIVYPKLTLEILTLAMVNYNLSGTTWSIDIINKSIHVIEDNISMKYYTYTTTEEYKAALQESLVYVVEHK